MKTHVHTYTNTPLSNIPKLGKNLIPIKTQKIHQACFWWNLAEILDPAYFLFYSFKLCQTSKGSQQVVKPPKLNWKRQDAKKSPFFPPRRSRKVKTERTVYICRFKLHFILKFICYLGSHSAHSFYHGPHFSYIAEAEERVECRVFWHKRSY